MSIFGMIMSGLALASDAFAVSICKGLSLNKVNFKECIIVGLWFGIFQGIMPILGYLFGIKYESIIIHIDHYIAFILLIYIGIKIILESFNNKNIDDKLDIKNMLILSIATSIDALVFGIAYACAYQEINGYLLFLIIGSITFILSSIGVFIGNKVGNKINKISMILGGIILILLGIKILLEHLNRL